MSIHSPLSTDLVTVLLVTLFVLAPAGALAQPGAPTVGVKVHPERVLRSFDPSTSLGAALDGHDEGEIERRLTPRYVAEMMKAGLGPVTYRLRTELAGEAWHWTPNGAFSDAASGHGYWTGSTDAPPGGISASYGYRLPRRGNTVDQANNDSYSRIDDGDQATFWKSNPYLDTTYTHDPNSMHEQWVIVDLERPVPVDAIKIVWGDQFATDLEVSYTTGKLLNDFGLRPEGGWHPFRTGHITQSSPDTNVHRLSPTPIAVRYIRILLKSYEHRGKASNDVRDNIGFAIRELYAGTRARGGGINDAIVHGTTNKSQSSIFVSSTDPWHRSEDIDRNTEHVGFERLVATGLNRSKPMMVPVGLLYDTPENAAAEIQYLVNNKIPFDRVELGEEPDGQNVDPIDFAALYVQFADAIHRVAPDAKLGGPSFQDIVSNIGEREEHAGNGLWLRRALEYLKTKGHEKDFSFFSYEWYPYDDVCAPTAPKVRGSAAYLRQAMEAMWADGLPRSTPFIITEYGYSPFASAAEDDLEGAIVNLDGVGTMLALGGEATFLYGYEPDEVEHDSPCTAGNNMILLMMPDGSLRRTATFYAAQLMTTEWLQPAGGAHALIGVDVTNELIGAYAVKRPDGLVSVLLLNRDSRRSIPVSLTGIGQGKSMDVYRYSHSEYRWNKTLGRPSKSDPPTHSNAELGKPMALPPLSITVLRER